MFPAGKGKPHQYRTDDFKFLILRNSSFDFEMTVNTDDVVLLSRLLTGEDLPLPNIPTQNKLGDLL